MEKPVTIREEIILNKTGLISMLQQGIPNDALISICAVGHQQSEGYLTFY